MKTIFRFEIWFCKGPDKKELEEAKKNAKNNLTKTFTNICKTLW